MFMASQREELSNKGEEGTPNPYLIVGSKQ